MLDWLDENKTLLLWISIGSAVFFVASIVVVCVVIVRMPADYFANRKRERRENIGLRIARNLLGWLLILSGVAMLFLPGQGVLVLLIGVMLADFPGKYRVERWIISRGKVTKTINWLRAKFDRPPIEVDGTPETKT